MSKWSTTAVEQVIRKALAPLVGLGVFIGEALLRDGEPRLLIVSAAVGLVFGQPVARILDGRRAPDPPPPPAGDPPPSRAVPGAGPS